MGCLNNRDLLWGYCYCGWAEVKAIAKRTKKWSKLGLYVEVEELAAAERQRLCTKLIRDGEDARVLKKYVLFPVERTMFWNKDVFKVSLYGPKIRTPLTKNANKARLAD